MYDQWWCYVIWLSGLNEHQVINKMCSTYFNILTEKFSTFHDEFLIKNENQIFLNRKYLKTTFYVELALLDGARGLGPGLDVLVVGCNLHKK